MSDFLKDKIINEVKVAADKQAILFICDDGDHIAKADADCCSHTWIENIEIPGAKGPWKVISTEDLDLGEIDGGKDSDCLQKYGYKIVTDKGLIEIDFRNESNGYYGGSLSWPNDDYFYGGVFGQNVSENIWKDVPWLNS